MQVKIKITKKNIEQGVQDCVGNHPVALALRDIGFDTPCVTSKTISFYNKKTETRYYYKVWEELAKYIENFDDYFLHDNPTRPAVFTLEKADLIGQIRLNPKIFKFLHETISRDWFYYGDEILGIGAACYCKGKPKPKSQNKSFFVLANQKHESHDLTLPADVEDFQKHGISRKQAIANFRLMSLAPRMLELLCQYEYAAQYMPDPGKRERNLTEFRDILKELGIE